MKILEVYPNFHLQKGGVQRHIYDICTESIRRGHKPMVLTWGPSRQTTETIDGIIVKRVYVPRLFSVLRFPLILYLSLHMFYLVRKFKINVIHAHDYLPGESAALTGLLSGTSTVVTFHLPVQSTTYHLPSYLLPSALIEKIFKRCFVFWVGSIICVSKFTYDDAIKLGFSRSKLRVIYNWATFLSSSKESSNIDTSSKKNLPKKPFILTVGRLLEKQKRFSLLIKAFKLLLDKGYVLDLVIVGDGPDKKAYQKLVHSLNLNNQVHFLCNIPDANLINIYQKCEIFAFPSSIEGMPLVLLEAMYYGKPIVATAVGGIPEIVENDYNGYLINPDPESISNAIEKILLQSNLKKIFGLRSQEIISKKLSYKNLKDTIILFERIANV